MQSIKPDDIKHRRNARPTGCGREEMRVTAEFKLENGEVVGAVAAQAKQFRTGSRGFFGTAKLQVDGKQYQVQVQLVEIGSKPTT